MTDYTKLCEELRLRGDAATALQKEKGAIGASLDKLLFTAYAAIESLQAENARLQAERDAVMKDLAKVSVCGTCVHYAPHSKGKCSKHRHKIVDSNFAGCTCWQWRGVREVEE